MLVACAGSVSSIWVVRVQDKGVTVVRLGCGELSAGFDSSFDGGENRSGIRVAENTILDPATAVLVIQAERSALRFAIRCLI